jgi:hypothetical protein
MKEGERVRYMGHSAKERHWPLLDFTTECTEVTETPAQREDPDDSRKTSVGIFYRPHQALKMLRTGYRDRKPCLDCDERRC